MFSWEFCDFLPATCSDIVYTYGSICKWYSLCDCMIWMVYINHISHDFMYPCIAPIPRCILPIVCIADIWYASHVISLTYRPSLGSTVLSVVCLVICKMVYYGHSQFIMAVCPSSYVDNCKSVVRQCYERLSVFIVIITIVCPSVFIVCLYILWMQWFIQGIYYSFASLCSCDDVTSGYMSRQRLLRHIVALLRVCVL